MSPSQRISVYIPDHLGGVLDVLGNSMTARIVAIIDRYGCMIQAARVQFSRAEWMLILDACNGWHTLTEPGETLTNGLALAVADHARLNDVAAKWTLSNDQVRELVARLQSLSIPETITIVEAVERFWRRHHQLSDEAMEQAGIAPDSGS